MGEYGNPSKIIAWRVLEKEGDYALVISESCLYDMPFSRSGKSNEWRKSTVRRFLNNDFTYAFTDEEFSKIKETTNSEKLSLHIKSDRYLGHGGQKGLHVSRPEKIKTEEQPLSHVMR